MPPQKTFAQLAVEQAVEQAARVDLTVDPVTPHSDRRLISRALGMAPDGVALTAPAAADGRKVFLPDDWRVGLAFDLAGLWFQALSRVVRHCFFAAQWPGRVDAIVVRCPERLASCNRRQSLRRHLSPDEVTKVTLWRVTDAGPGAEACMGSLVDLSANGLGVETKADPGLARDTAVRVRVRLPGTAEAVVLSGSVKHCSPGPTGWKVGIGDACELDGRPILIAEDWTHAVMYGNRAST